MMLYRNYMCVLVCCPLETMSFNAKTTKKDGTGKSPGVKQIAMVILGRSFCQHFAPCWPKTLGLPVRWVVFLAISGNRSRTASNSLADLLGGVPGVFVCRLLKKGPSKRRVLMNRDFALDDLHYLMRDSSFWKNQNLLDLPWKSERPPFFNRFFGTEFHPKAIPAFCLMVGRSM